MLGRMAENILDAYQCLSAGAAVRPQAVELVSHLERLAQLVAPCAARQGGALAFSAGAQSLAVMTDRILADRVVLNLLSNAVYHGGARGHVWMELEPGEDKHLLRVRDDGPGLPAALADRLNSEQPFSPAVYPGQRSGAVSLPGVLQGAGLAYAYYRQPAGNQRGTDDSLRLGCRRGAAFLAGVRHAGSGRYAPDGPAGVCTAKMSTLNGWDVASFPPVFSLPGMPRRPGAVLVFTLS